MADGSKGARKSRRSSERGGARPRDDARPDGAAGSRGEAGAPTYPRWLPAAVFVGLTLVLFRGFVFSDEMLYGSDTLGLGYVVRAWYAGALSALGSVPDWSPLILGGTPFLEALSAGDSLYPPSVLLLLLLEPYRALGWKLVVHVAAAGFFMFGWVRALGGSRAAALVGGTGYMLAPYFVSFVHPGHDGKLFVTALAPLLFWAVERHFLRPGIRTFAAIALVIGFVILTTHFQMAYFLFGGVGLYAIFRSVQLWRGTAPDEEAVRRAAAGAGGDVGADDGTAARATPGDGAASLRPAASRFGLFLGAALVGAGVGGVQLIPAVDYVTEHSRRTQTTREAAGESGIAWSSSWSMHPEEALTLVVPEFVGNNAGGAAWATNTYWGRNPFKDNTEYVGLVLLVLATLSFAGGARRALRWFFAGLAGVALLFALGTHTPVWRIFYELMPGIRLFRVPAQAMLLFTFGVATLAALGADRLFALRGERDSGGGDGSSALKILGGVTGAVALLALLLSSGTFLTVWTSTLWPDIPPQRFETMRGLLPFMVRGAWFAVLLAGGVWALAWGSRSRRIPQSGVLAGLLLLVAVDAIRVNEAFIETLDFQEWAAPGPHIEAVMALEEQDDEPYRLLSFRRSGQDVRPAIYGIELAAGHHPNDLSRYRELIGMVGSSFPEHLGVENIRRILNVEYILWPDLEMGGSLQGTVVAQQTLADGRPYETVLADDGLPRARLVGSAVVRSDEEAVPYMLSDAFDPEREVVLPEPSPVALADGPVDGTVTWLERTPNRLVLEVESSAPALLVVADNWYPAWHASVDGEEAPVLRAYHTLRAVPVPEGSSTVEMTYESDVVRWSLWLSVALALGLGAAIVLSVLRDRGRTVRP